MHDANSQVRDARSGMRFFLDPQLDGRFGNVPIAIADFGEHGVQVEHPAPLKVGTLARLAFALPPDRMAIELSGMVVWSRLSQKADSHGKLLYRSGIRIEEHHEVARGALERLVDAAIAHPATASLETKKQMLAEKERLRAAQPVMKPIVVRKPEIDPEQVLLIQHAHDQLKGHPDEAIKWYNRAKFSLSETGTTQLHYREDILAIWEYLGRTIDIRVIAKVFEGKK
jgi:hypothetical protein